MAGRIPQTFIDELLGRVDIVDIIDSRVPLKSAGRGEYKACCPFHEEKTPSFTVSADKQFYHCFGCGEHGTSVGFLMNYAHLSFVEAIEELAAHAGVDVPYEAYSTTHGSAGQGVAAPAAASADSANLLDLLERASQFYKQVLREGTPLAENAIEYLKNRGLSGETARSFEIGLAPDGWDKLAGTLGIDEATLRKLEKAGLVNRRDNGGYYDRFRGRIIFPIHDFKGRVVAFGGRVLDDGEPKYLNSPETPVFHKGSELYGLFRSRGAIKEKGFALVVEGYMDVIVLAQFDIDNAVATLGTATTRAHLERLFRYTDEIVFCFDGDKAGERAAWRALENALPVIKATRQVKFLFLPDGHDPDSLVREKGRQGFEALIAGAQPLSEFLLSKLQQQTDLTHLDGRAKLLSLARPYLEKLAEGPLRQLLIERLAAMAQTEFDTVQSQARAAGTGEGRRPVAKPGKPIGPESLSYMARAISLLILHPDLNQGCRDQLLALRGLEIRGLELLMEISEMIEQNPNLNTASIIERYRGTPEHRPLEKLATQTHLIRDSDRLVPEFEAILKKMSAAGVDAKRKQIMADTESGRISGEQAAKMLKKLHNTGI